MVAFGDVEGMGTLSSAASMAFFPEPKDFVLALGLAACSDSADSERRLFALEVAVDRGNGADAMDVL